MRSQVKRARRGAHGPSRSWALCALGILALALTGCGGASGDGGSPQALAAGPRTQLIAQADAICKRRNGALDAVPLAGSKAASVEHFAAQSAALERTALSELSRLAPPAAIARAWQQILDYSRALLGDIVKLEEYAKRDDERGIPALSHAVEAAKLRLQLVGTRAGFGACSLLR